MAGRRFAILLPLLTLVVAALSGAAPAHAETQSNHQVVEDAIGMFQLPDGNLIAVSARNDNLDAGYYDLLIPVGGGSYDVRYHPTSDVEFAVEQSLTSAHLSGTFVAEWYGSWPPVIRLDISWEGVGAHHVHEEMSEYRTTPDICGDHVVHADRRSAMASATVNGIPVQVIPIAGAWSPYIETYFYQSTNDDC